MRVITLILLLVVSACGRQADPRQALDAARALADAGDYEGALAKHIWFHEHALEIDRGYYGVRLSFALSDWVELGAKYPKALETLKGIRDAKGSRLLAGEADRELFQDVAAINSVLGESSATVELFKRLAAVNPSFAGEIYNAADKALAQAHEYQLSRKYLGDPAERLAQARRQYEQGIKTTESLPNAAARRAFEHIFRDDVLRLITILSETGEAPTAGEIQSEALKTLDQPEIRKAIVR